MKRKRLRIVVVLLLLCVAAAAFIAYQMYNKPHRSVANSPATAISASQLAAAYGQDEAAANKKYLGNALQVTGTVSEVSVNQQNKQVILLNGSDMSGVQCTLQETVNGIRNGDAITIKGFCSGYLTDVILDRCIVDKP